MGAKFLVVTFGLAAFCASAWELGEQPAAPGEWGYRPEDDVTVVTSPPPFTWRPEETAVHYSLEIARDGDFREVVYGIGKLPWSAHCPDAVLAEGEYFWRYRGVDGDGVPSSWSRVRKFTVPREAASFPKPGPDVLASRIPQSHPKLFFRPEEVSRLRELADGPLAAEWKALVARAEKLLANPPDTAEPPKYPEGIERKGAEWRRIWWGNRVYVIAAADGAATLAFVYRLTGDRRFGEAARDMLLALCEWDTKGATNYDYNDEAAMPLLYYPARAYTWAHDVFSAGERARIQEMMRARGRDCFDNLQRRNHLWRPYSSHHNRAWHWLGEIATAFHGEIEEAPLWLDYSMTVYFTCYPVWGDADGGWHEGQAYWASYLVRFMYWAMVSQSIYGIDPFERPFFRETGYFGLYTCPPGTKSGAWGDQAILSDSGRIAQFMGLMAIAADNPHWRWYAEQHDNPRPDGYFGFLVAANARGLQGKAPEQLPSSRLFRGTGLAVLNSSLLDGRENVQVHFKSSPFGTQSHGYNANNSFMLHLRGERALIRSGRRDIHGSPHHREWMWETKSDNAILVNGVGQYPHTQQAQGLVSHFHTDAKLDVVAGEAGESYRDLERWTRRILFFKPHVILIHDVLEADEPVTFQWLLHAQAPFSLSDNEAILSLDNGTVAVRFIAPEGLVLSQTDEFDTPPHEWVNFTLEEWHLSAGTTNPARATEFVTLLRVDDAPLECAREAAEEGVRVSLVGQELEASVFLGNTMFSIETEDKTLVFSDTAL